MWCAIDAKTGRNFVDDAVQSEIIESLRRSDAVTVSYELVRGLGSHGDMRQRIESIESPVLALWPSGPAGKERKSREAVAAQYAELRDVVWRTVDVHGAGRHAGGAGGSRGAHHVILGRHRLPRACSPASSTLAR